MSKWKTTFIAALHRLTESERILVSALYELLEEKGFKKKVLHHFGITFAGGGGETVITFDGEGEMANLDIDIASRMTKEEIIKTLSDYLSSENVELLNQLA